MADAAAGGRRQIAMEGANPSEDMLKRTAFMVPAEIAYDFVEVFPLDGAFAALQALKGSRSGFKKPEDFLNGLSDAALGQELLGLSQRLFNDVLRLLVQRDWLFRHGNRNSMGVARN